MVKRTKLDAKSNSPNERAQPPDVGAPWHRDFADLVPRPSQPTPGPPCQPTLITNLSHDPGLDAVASQNPGELKRRA
jgi:hypothetical protein